MRIRQRLLLIEDMRTWPVAVDGLVLWMERDDEKRPFERSVLEEFTDSLMSIGDEHLECRCCGNDLERLNTVC